MKIIIKNLQTSSNTGLQKLLSSLTHSSNNKNARKVQVELTRKAEKSNCKSIS